MTWWWALLIVGVLYKLVLLWLAFGRPTPVAALVLWDRARCPRGCWELVQADDYGTLWESRSLHIHHLLVEVVDSTPDRRGNRKTHRIRVPLTVRTAHEAVAWTFRFTRADDYRPDVET